LTPIITAATAFLIAVLWFDLMFDVQVLAHRRANDVPEPVLSSIAAYYRRVTTTASPMVRLVMATMLVLLGALAAQAIRGDVARWVSAAAIVAAVLGIGLAAVRTFGAARRLGARTDPADVQSRAAWSILRDHLVCIAAMATLLAVQLVAG
jgi:hypothetical protein